MSRDASPVYEACSEKPWWCLVMMQVLYWSDRKDRWVEVDDMPMHRETERERERETALANSLILCLNMSSMQCCGSYEAWRLGSLAMPCPTRAHRAVEVGGFIRLWDRSFRLMERQMRA
eukprot:4574487-Amphidinium_carterae.1